MTRIAFFPMAYPDEDFRSLIYRYHVRAGYRDLANTNMELFGVKTEKNPHIPRNLNTFLSRLPSNHEISTIELLYNHTLWPLVKPFLSDDQIEQSLKEVYEGVEGARNYAVRHLSLKESRILSSEIRYCPECLREDFNTYGECFVHRSHQIHAIDICAVHTVDLVTHCAVCKVQFSKGKGDSLLLTPHCSNGHEISTVEISSPDTLAAKIELYTACQSIMAAAKHIGRSEINHRLQIALFQKGYTNITGRTIKHRIIKDVESELSNPRITEISRLLSHKSAVKGIRVMLRGEWHLQSLPFYAFIMTFLCDSTKNFLQNTMAISVPLPFGSGPWKCKNRVCTHHSTEVIQHCLRQIVGNTVSGTFVCATCGCTYHKKWWPGRTEDDNRFTISTMGPVWNAKLIDLYHQGYTHVEIARNLKTTREHVVKRIALLTDAAHFVKSDCSQPTTNRTAMETLSLATLETAASLQYTNKVLKYREIVTKLMKTDSNLGRTDIYRIAPGAYSWLRKNDREWLEQSLPKPQSVQIRRDWRSIDDALAQRVRKIAVQIYHDNPPKRIAKYVIINACSIQDRHHLQASPSKVPKAWQVLLQYEESKEDYLIRHTPSIVRQLLRDGYTNVTLNSILAFRRTYRGCSDRVRHEIVKILRELGFKNVEYGVDQYL